MSGTGRRCRRVAVIAFTSQPGLGSEYEVGWRWSLLTARSARATVLTRRACWEAIPGRARFVRGILAKHCEGATFVAVDIPGAPALFPGRRLMRTHYLLWQLLVLAWLRRHRRHFDFVHHLTFVAAWFPPLAAFAGLPTIWGPIGTNPPIPRFLIGTGGPRKRLASALRRFVTVELVRCNPVLASAGRNIVGGFAIAEHVRRLLPPDLQTRIDVHPAIALDESWEIPAAGQTGPDILFVGRAIDIKLPQLAYDVCSEVARLRPGTSAVLIGEGLPGYIDEHQKSENIRVEGAIGQNALRALYAGSRLFLFPSLESSGFVTLEAMASGLPVVCLEHTGGAFFAGQSCGRIVAPGPTYKATVEQLAGAVQSLLDNPDVRESAGAMARIRAREFGWAGYATYLGRLYDEAGNRQSR